MSEVTAFGQLLEAWIAVPAPSTESLGEISGVIHDFSQPCLVDCFWPIGNALLIERFNNSYRDEVLDVNLFSTLSEVQALTEWMMDYNEFRPMSNGSAGAHKIYVTDFSNS